jgi:hypothetical protein
MAGSPRLFEHDLPPELHYRDDFITETEERHLLDAIAQVAFSDFGCAASSHVDVSHSLANRTTA